MFVRSMYTCFVARIPLRCPRLKLLTLYNNNNNNSSSTGSSTSSSSSSRSNLLQNLPELKQLAKVVFEDLPPASSAAAAAATGNSSLSSKAAAAAVAVAAQRGPVRVKLEREE